MHESYLYLFTPKTPHSCGLNTPETLFCHETHNFMIFHEFLLLDFYDNILYAAPFAVSLPIFILFCRKLKIFSRRGQKIRKQTFRPSLVWTTTTNSMKWAYQRICLKIDHTLKSFSFYTSEQDSADPTQTIVYVQGRASPKPSIKKHQPKREQVRKMRHSMTNAWIIVKSHAFVFVEFVGIVIPNDLSKYRTELQS